MPTENRHRLWAFGKPRIVKHMPRVKTTTVGFYALNGTSVLRADETLHKERIVEVFEAIHEQNPAGRILLMLDNFSSHVAEYTRRRAHQLGIDLVFLPVGSPDLNPIEPVWKSLRWEASPLIVESAEFLRALVTDLFDRLTDRMSFAVAWIEKFLAPCIQKLSE